MAKSLAKWPSSNYTCGDSVHCALAPTNQCTGTDQSLYSPEVQGTKKCFETESVWGGAILKFLLLQGLYCLGPVGSWSPKCHEKCLTVQKGRFIGKKIWSYHYLYSNGYYQYLKHVWVSISKYVKHVTSHLILKSDIQFLTASSEVAKTPSICLFILSGCWKSVILNWLVVRAATRLSF